MSRFWTLPQTPSAHLSRGQQMVISALRKTYSKEPVNITTQSTGTSTHYSDQSTQVAEWLDSCPDSVSKVTTVNMISQSNLLTASCIPFPALQNDKVAVEDIDGQGDALSTDYEDLNVSEYKPSDGDSDDSIGEDTTLQECKVTSSTHPALFVKRAVSRNGNIVLDKKQFCYFCQKPQLKHARHVTKHTDEPFVAKLLAKKDSDTHEYLNGLRRLKCLGNFVHNIKSLKEGRTDIVVVKRPTKERKVSDYLPCIHCYGFYVIDELWKHTKNCDLKTSETDLNVHTCADESKQLMTDSNIVGQSKLLLASACLPDTETGRFSKSSSMSSMINKMRYDKLTEIVSKDCLLMRFGETLLSKYGPTRKNDVATRIRQLARLLVQVRENLKDSTLTFFDALCGKKFDACLEGTLSICGLNITNDGRREFAIPSLALRLGHLLKKLVATKQGYCLRNEELDGLKQAETFGQLLQGEWTDKIATNAHNTLKRRRDHVIQVLPITEDLRILREYQLKEMKHAIESLKSSPSYSTWRKLAQLVMTRMTIFNKRRGGEVSKLLLETYQTRPDWKGNTNEEVLKSLKPLERQLLNRVDLVQIPGKKARKVPMLITMDVKQGIDILNETRESVGIPSSNPFCFASRSSTGHLNNWQALHIIAQEANLSHPEHVTSTKLRKYNATVSQLFDLNHGELEWLSNHMGHDLNIHKDFYRLHDSTIEIAKVSRLLMAIDTGNASQFIGKHLDEINLDDFQFAEQGHDVDDVPEKYLADEPDSEGIGMYTSQKSSLKQRNTQKRKRVNNLSDSESQDEITKLANPGLIATKPMRKKKSSCFPVENERALSEEHIAIEVDSDDMSINTTQGFSKKWKTSQQKKRVHHLFDSESENDRAKPMKNIVKSEWSPLELETLKTLFGHILRNGLYPSGKQINLAIKHHACLKRRNTLNVRSKLQHLMKNNSF